MTLLPPIPHRRASEIAARHAGVEVGTLAPASPGKVVEQLYNPPKEPCWAFHCPWNDGEEPSIRDSRLILVSKLTGEILYDGPAGDEG